jgi:hypothetical protein
MGISVSEPISKEILKEQLSCDDSHENGSMIEVLSDLFARSFENSQDSIEQMVCYHETLTPLDRDQMAQRIARAALIKNKIIVLVSTEIIERLDLMNCLPALSLVIENYPRGFGTPLRQQISHLIRQMQARIWEMPWEERFRLEMDNILRRGRLEYADPEAQASFAARWLADYLEDHQRRGYDISSCRSWILDGLSAGKRIHCLASLELCGIFRIKESVTALSNLAKMPEFQNAETPEHRRLTNAFNQLASAGIQI